MFVVLSAVVLAWGTILAQASPDPDDPTGGAAESLLHGVKEWVTNHGMILLAGLLLLGVVVGILFRYATWVHDDWMRGGHS